MWMDHHLSQEAGMLCQYLRPRWAPVIVSRYLWDITIRQHIVCACSIHAACRSWRKELSWHVYQDCSCAFRVQKPVILGRHVYCACICLPRTLFLYLLPASGTLSVCKASTCSCPASNKDIPCLWPHTPPPPPPPPPPPSSPSSHPILLFPIATSRRQSHAFLGGSQRGARIYMA